MKRNSIASKARKVRIDLNIVANVRKYRVIFKGEAQPDIDW
jgi:hypothetical protein